MPPLSPSSLLLLLSRAAATSSRRTCTIAPWVRILYYSFNLAGAGLLTILAVTLAFVTPVHRQVTLLNLCVAWIVWALALSYLLFAGEDRGPPPTFSNCLTSASMVLAVSAVGPSAALSLVLQMYLSVVHPIQHGLSYTYIVILLVVAPWVLGIAFLIASLVVGLRSPSLVTRGKLYCTIDSSPLTDLNSAVVVVNMAGTILLIVLIALKLRRSYLRSHRVGALGDRQLYLRVLVFGAYVLFALVAGAIAIADYTSLVPDMVTSTVPLAIFFIFGSQRDILTVWHLRKRHDGHSAATTPSHSTCAQGNTPSGIRVVTNVNTSPHASPSPTLKDSGLSTVSRPVSEAFIGTTFTPTSSGATAVALNSISSDSRDREVRKSVRWEDDLDEVKEQLDERDRPSALEELLEGGQSGTQEVQVRVGDAEEGRTRTNVLPQPVDDEEAPQRVAPIFWDSRTGLKGP